MCFVLFPPSFRKRRKFMMKFYLKVGENVPEFETSLFVPLAAFLLIFFLPLTFQAKAVMFRQTNLL